MADASESFVQLQQDSTGKKIRNLVRGHIVLDGVPSANGVEDRYIQITALVDAEGRLVSPDTAWREEMLQGQRQMIELLEQILERL